MKSLGSIPFSSTFRSVLLLGAFLIPQLTFGQWQARLGSQVPDCSAGAEGDVKLANGCQARQVMAFVPNEIWIHQNDSITWTHATDEGHTVTFLYQPQPATLAVGPYPAAQQRPSGAVGCTAYGGATSADGSAYDPSGVAGLQCVNSGTLSPYGETYTVNFPAQGNFKFTCLIHASMFGMVHVLAPTAALPYTQGAYNAQTAQQVVNLAADLVPFGLFVNGAARVYTVGKILSTGGGWQYASMFRFVDAQGNIITKNSPLKVHVGQTVEFVNLDPAEPHTITFGCPTDDATCPVGGGAGAFVDTSGPKGTDGDGARFAVLNAPFDPADETNRDANSTSEINSGLLIAEAQDRASGLTPLSGTPGTSVPLAQVSPTLNRFRVTFNATGQYRWICELHDEIGMIGWVKVVP